MKILEEIIISDALGLDILDSKINYARGETILPLILHKVNKNVPKNRFWVFKS